jgi:hypothetical protein
MLQSLRSAGRKLSLRAIDESFVFHLSSFVN